MYSCVYCNNVMFLDKTRADDALWEQKHSSNKALTTSNINIFHVRLLWECAYIFNLYIVWTSVKIYINLWNLEAGEIFDKSAGWVFCSLMITKIYQKKRKHLMNSSSVFVNIF